MKQSDLPLVRGGRLPQRALDWIAHVAKFFPGVERDIIVIRKTSRLHCARKTMEDFGLARKNKG
jgi:hypothetical protein